jgi:rare lipoprotein A
MNGHASYYAHEFAGRRTASGEIFDPYARTAAHRTLPFGTCVRVTRIDNGDSILVRINDRGPYVAGRIIDLSLGAAEELAIIARGTARVRIESVEMPEEMIRREAARVDRARGAIEPGAESIAIRHAVLPIGCGGICEYVADAGTGETRAIPFTVVGRVRVPPREVVLDERSRARTAIRLLPEHPSAASGTGAWPSNDGFDPVTPAIEGATGFAWPPEIPRVAGDASGSSPDQMRSEPPAER